MSTWRVYAEQLFTSAFGGSQPIFSQRFKLPSDSAIVCIRTQLEVLNSPVYTSAEMRIYGDNRGYANSLLYTSSTVSPATICVLAYGRKEIPFDFTQVPQLKGGAWYHAVLWLNGYTGTTSSHIGWIRAYPDPMNTTNFTATVEKIAVTPFAMTVIGAAP